jgi:drug/metabolite transporter (DMT)-like permease
VSLAFSAGRITRAELPAVSAAVATGLTIAGYTLVDGFGVRRSHDAYAYAALLFLLQGPVFPAIVLAGWLSVAAYGGVLWAQTRAPLAEVAALRETSVVFAAVIGAVALKERFGGRRVAAALLVAAGILLIAA